MVVITRIERQLLDNLIEIGIAAARKIGKAAFRVQKSNFVLDPKRNATSDPLPLSQNIQGRAADVVGPPKTYHQSTPYRR